MLNEDNVEQVTLEVVRGGETAEIVYTPEANDTLMTGENVKTPFFRPEMRVYVFPLPGSAAKKAGLQPEDIVTAVEGIPVYGSDELMSRISFSNGKTLRLTVERGGKTLEIPVTPTKVPGATERPMVGINFSPAKAPVEVMETIPGLPAADVLRAGDVIVSFNGHQLDAPAKFSELVAENGLKEIALAVERGGEQIEVKLTPDRKSVV